MRLVRAAITAITYAGIALAAYWLWGKVPPIDQKFMGVATAAVGALFTLVDGFFWKTLDGSHDLVKSGALTSRTAIALRKRMDLRMQFLKRRWVFSFIVYLICLFAGLAIFAWPSTSTLPLWLPRLVIALMAATIPAIASLILARMDSIGLATDISLAQREHDDREKAIAEMKK